MHYDLESIINTLTNRIQAVIIDGEQPSCVSVESRVPATSQYHTKLTITNHI